MTEYERVSSSVESRIAADPRIRALRKKIEQGTATLADSSKYSQLCAQIMGQQLSVEVLGLSDREGVCTQLLRDRYNDINQVCEDTMRSVDARAGIAMNPRRASFPEERVQQLAHSLTDPTVPDETIQRRADTGAANVAVSFHDDFVKENAAFRSDAGYESYITRVVGGASCPWCSGMAGRYKYDEMPDDMFRRHDNCTCTVTFEQGAFRQDVWSKRSWEAPETGAGASPPKVFSKEEADTLEQEHLAQIRGLRFNSSSIDNSAKGAILKGEYNEEDIIRAITQEGTNFVTKDPNDPESIFGELVELVPRDERYYDIKAHGSPEAVKLFGSVVDANTLARVIIMRKDYDGKPIRLLCCETGKMVNGTCFAKELSKLLQVDVLAPTEEFWVSTLGEIKIESKDSGKKGFMKPFKYKRR